MLWADIHTIIEFNLRVVRVFARLISASAEPPVRKGLEGSTLRPDAPNPDALILRSSSCVVHFLLLMFKALKAPTLCHYELVFRNLARMDASCPNTIILYIKEFLGALCVTLGGCDIPIFPVPSGESEKEDASRNIARDCSRQLFVSNIQ